MKQQPAGNDKEIIDLAFKMISYQENQDIYTDSTNSIFAPYQLSVKYAVHPMSDKYRFLVNHSTGSGKTLTSLLVARNFLNYNLRVFVVTFNQSQFEKELQTIPELGFISHSELKTIKNYPNMQDEIIRKVHKRIKSRISFIGYKELFIRVFAGQGGVNMEYLNQFRGSLVICDEIHNIYNHYKKNIYGVSIQFLSYMMGTNIYLLYLSATPLSYSKELGALLNIMQVSQDQDIQIQEFINQVAIKNKLIQESANSEETIQQKNVQDQIEQLQSYLQKPYDLEDKSLINTIKEILKDKVSYVPEIQKNFPKFEQIGQVYKAIDNVYLYRCEITQEFSKNMMDMTNYLAKDESFKDIILHPEYDITSIVKQLKRNNLQLVKWANSLDISITKSLINDTLTGPYLQVENIGKYSPKLGVLIQQLLTLETKSFIYINNIQGFGVDLICELLKVNGILLFDKAPIGSSICFKCKQMFRNHDNSHQFVAYRAIVITGQNINQGDQYLKRFNSLENIVNSTYQIVIGSIKMKEGYNVMGVNNAFVLSLPYNFTNYIQVIGRCARNKSHFDLPVQQQYVKNYFLIHASKDAHSYESHKFQDLMNNKEKSTLYGKITREELELWTKSLDFKQVQYYESIIHGVSIDTKYFYPIYFKTNQLQPGQFEVLSDNKLKMLPFTFEVPVNMIEPIDNIWEQDLNTFYLLDIASSINRQITAQINKLLKIQSIWDIEHLIQTILKTDQAPNISIVPRDLVKQKIFTTQNVYIIDNFVIYSRQQPQLDFFFNSQLYTPAISLNITKQDESPIDPALIVELYKYIEQHFKPYVIAISQKKVLNASIKMSVTSKHTLDIYNMINQLFRNVSLNTVQQLYKSEIIKYNQQINNNQVQRAHYIAVLNLVLPFIYESSFNQNKKVSIDQNQSSSSKTFNSDLLILNGFLIDIHTQMYIHPNGDHSEISVQRDKVFADQIGIFKLFSQQFKLQDLSQLYQHKNIQQKTGAVCISLEKLQIKNKIETKGSKTYDKDTKQDLCQQLQLLYIQEYLSAIFHFHQYFNFLFQFN